MKIIKNINNNGLLWKRRIWSKKCSKYGGIVYIYEISNLPEGLDWPRVWEIETQNGPIYLWTVHNEGRYYYDIVKDLNENRIGNVQEKTLELCKENAIKFYIGILSKELEFLTNNFNANNLKLFKEQNAD